MSRNSALRFCRRNRLQILCVLYTVILTFGVLVAATLSDDSRWMGWSLSRLGETVVNRHSALAFNAGVFMSSLVLIMIGVGMSKGYVKLRQLRTAKVSVWLITLLAICMIGVALCPNDTMHAVHFIFSRGVVITMVVMMLVLPSSLSYLTRRERMLSFSFPIFTAALAMQGYVLRSFWFVIVEVILGLFAAAWLFAVCRHLDMRLQEQSD